MGSARRLRTRAEPTAEVSEDVDKSVPSFKPLQSIGMPKQDEEMAAISSCKLPQSVPMSKQDEEMVAMEEKWPTHPKTIYFGGCCWGVAFYIGFYTRLWEMYGPNMVDDYGICFTGDSAGCVVALFMALGMHPEELASIYRRISEDCIATQPWYNVWENTGSSVFCEETIRRVVLSDPLAYKKLVGKFYCGSTVWYDQHRWHVSWSSNEDLMNTLKGCYHIPFYCHSQNGPLYGAHCVDGAYGFQGSDLIDGDYTLFIGIDPHAEITRTFTNAEMFYPASGKKFDDMVVSGYDAAKAWDGRFLKKVGQMSDDSAESRYAVPRHASKSDSSNDNVHRKGLYPRYWKPYRVANHPALSVLWVMSFLERFIKPIACASVCAWVWIFGWKVALAMVVTTFALLKYLRLL